MNIYEFISSIKSPFIMFSSAYKYDQCTSNFFIGHCIKIGFTVSKKSLLTLLKNEITIRDDVQGINLLTNADRKFVILKACWCVTIVYICTSSM